MLIRRNRVRVRTGIRCDDDCCDETGWVTRALVTTLITVGCTAAAEVIVDRLKAKPLPAEEAPAPRRRK